MQKRGIHKYPAWLLILIFMCTLVFVSVGMIEAANAGKVIKSITVNVDGKKVTKKTVTLYEGQEMILEVSASPRRVNKQISYKSNRKNVAAVSKKGKVTAKKAGTAKIKITVSGKGYKKKVTWIKIQVVNSESAMPDIADTNTTKPDTEAPSATDQNTPTSEPDILEPSHNATADNVFIAYFSLSENTSSSKEEQSSSLDAISSASVIKDGENAYGNTENIAKLIQEKTGGTLYQIQTKETYSTDFDEVIDQNHTEMDTSYLPELKDNDLDISQYDIVFIGYPVWASTIPRAIHSFLNQYDLSGKTVIPFCTHNGYGSGNSYSTISDLCPNAVNLDGLAVEAEDVKNADSSVAHWLTGLNLSFQQKKPITVKTGDIVLDGILYNNELADEISAKFSLTVSLGGYGGREYYGSLPWTPQTATAGQYSFEDGEITYCAENNTIAIFYAQTERPNLTMEVVPIGKITSDLSVFDTLPSLHLQKNEEKRIGFYEKLEQKIKRFSYYGSSVYDCIFYEYAGNSSKCGI